MSDNDDYQGEVVHEWEYRNVNCKLVDAKDGFYHVYLEDDGDTWSGAWREDRWKADEMVKKAEHAVDKLFYSESLPISPRDIITIVEDAGYEIGIERYEPNMGLERLTGEPLTEDLAEAIRRWEKRSN
jgi:hypothetical protein